MSQPAIEQPLSDRFIARRVSVEVPATCANLGPGFDCVGLALDLRNHFEVEILPRDGAHPPCQVEVVVDGEGSETLEVARDGENLVCRAFALLCERVGIAPPALRVRVTARIPASRGLGSSATAVVGGLLAANTLLGDPLESPALLDLATACEPGGHADNVAAALLGGLVVTGARDATGGVIALPLPVPANLRAVIFIPDQPMSTVSGRALLPDAYRREDAVFNLSRLALLLGALQTGRFDLLATAMEDRIHQPYRERLFPQLGALMAAARAEGAEGACLSGGGSSMLALVGDDADGERAKRARAGLAQAAQRLGVNGRCVVVELARHGAAARIVSDGARAEGRLA